MCQIQNSCFYPFFQDKSVMGITAVTITALVLSIIGLTSMPGGTFNSIVQLGSSANGLILGTSIFVLILDLLWIAFLCKKNRLKAVTQTESDLPCFSRSSDQVDNKVTSKRSVENLPNTSQSNPAHSLPPELMTHIFSFLSMSELITCSTVSKQWQQLVMKKESWQYLDLQKLFPSLTVINEAHWITSFGLDPKEHGLDFTTVAVPFHKKKAIQILKKMLTPSKIEENAGTTLLIIPKGLSYNKLLQFTEPKEMRYKFFEQTVTDKIGNTMTDRAYYVILSNNILSESRKLPKNGHIKLVKALECEMPSVLAATAFTVLTPFFSRYDEDLTGTRCLEEINGRSVLVGGFMQHQAVVATFAFGSAAQTHSHLGVMPMFRLTENDSTV